MSDFVHTEELVDAVISRLRGADGATHTGGLPTSWFADSHQPADAETPLVLLEHGDLSDYPERILSEGETPAILIRGRGLQPYAQQAIGTVKRTVDSLRLVHLRGFDQCWDAGGDVLYNMTRARAYYAKVINRVLFGDIYGRLGVTNGAGTYTAPSLTSTDTLGAQINGTTWRGWDLGEYEGASATAEVAAVRSLGLRVWAIACDFDVLVTSGG